jgi:hypothetical protein
MQRLSRHEATLALAGLILTNPRLSGTASARRTGASTRRTRARPGEQTDDGSRDAAQANTGPRAPGTTAGPPAPPGRTQTWLPSSADLTTATELATGEKTDLELLRLQRDGCDPPASTPSGSAWNEGGAITRTPAHSGACWRRGAVSSNPSLRGSASSMSAKASEATSNRSRSVIGARGCPALVPPTALGRRSASRVHLWHRARPHGLQDVIARCGAKLRAARGGRVQWVDRQRRAAGNYLVVDARGTRSTTSTCTSRVVRPYARASGSRPGN